MNTIKQLNLLVSFLLEITLLIIAGYWGFLQSENVIIKYILAVALPVAIAILWGFFAAPKSKKRLKNPVRTIFKLALFFMAVIFIYQTGHLIWAIGFAVITLLNVIIAFIFSQDY